MKHLLKSLKLILLFSVLATINVNCKTKTHSTSNIPNSSNTSNTSGTAVTVDNIAGVYTITALKIKSSEGEKNMYDSLNECEKNASYGFNKDMVWYLGGVAKQDCTGPDDSGTWSLSGNELKIESKQSGGYQYKITDFNGRDMIVEAQANDNGTPMTLVTTFSKNQ